MRTDDDAGGCGKNGDFWMTSFVNDPLSYFIKYDSKIDKYVSKNEKSPFLSSSLDDTMLP